MPHDAYLSIERTRAGRALQALISLWALRALPGEADIVRRQGLEFVNIPIEFGNPTTADFESFVEGHAALPSIPQGERAQAEVRRQSRVNMRASTMIFLYRAIIDRESPEQAYEAVARVWLPGGPWKRLLVSELREAGIAFEPY